MFQNLATSQNKLIKPETFLFDWDCTLVDTKQVLCSAINQTLEALGMASLSIEQAYESTSMTPSQTFEYLFAEKAAEAKKKFYGILENAPMDDLILLEGAKWFLDYCQMQGYKMAVVSNKNSLMLRREIEHFGFDNFFGAIVGADDVEDSKPSPTPAITALEKLDTKAGQDVWFVGDNVVDWMCANAASCQPVRIWPNEKQSISIPEGTLSVKNFENLRDIIEKL